MTICERMFSLMEEKGKSGYGLSKKLKIDSGIISGWKRRGTNPPAKYLDAISEYLGVSIEFLCTGRKSPEPLEDERYFSEQEIRLIEKYRSLSEDGKDLIRGTLIQEQRREQEWLQTEEKKTAV